MDDEKIVALYFERDERAISETDRKYGPYLTKIAANILTDTEDARESVNDAYMGAWSSIPPNRPTVLRTYLVKLTRRIAIDRLRRRNRSKRGGGEYAMALEELGDIVSGDGAREAAELSALTDTIGAYLRTQPERTRRAFIGRYFYMDSPGEVARYCGMSEGALKSLLHRTRVGLRDYLIKEGFDL